MFKHAVIDNGSGMATVVVTGDAVFTDISELQRVVMEALDTCDDLTVDVRSADAVDLTFRVLMCSLHRRSALLNKRLSAQVHPPNGRHLMRYERVEGCPFKGPHPYCPLWDGPTGNDC